MWGFFYTKPQREYCEFCWRNKINIIAKPSKCEKECFTDWAIKVRTSVSKLQTSLFVELQKITEKNMYHI